jgi:hypothetical protein
MSFLKLLLRNSQLSSSRVMGQHVNRTLLCTISNDNKTKQGHHLRQFSVTAKPVQKHDWNRAVSEAEKIVG